MKLSFVIPAYNEELYIADCITSIQEHMKGQTIPFEILVINNASKDKTREIALQHGARVIDEPQKGLTKARQRGLIEAQGEWLAYIDADCRIHKHWFPTLQKLQLKHPTAVSISGPYRYYDGKKSLQLLMHAVWRISAPITYRIVGYMVLGGNFVAKKEALHAMGGFDQSIEFYGEDTDIARRLNDHGKVVFAMPFFVMSSTRRFIKQGFIKTNVLYFINFVWQVFFKKPFSNNS
jgi:glycosyltransferase involved in cell wall biosynthesis